MKNEREGTSEDYAKKEGVAHSELTVPNDAPEWAKALARLAERDAKRASETLWNLVERAEVRKDAQLAREILLALPRELSLDQQIALVRAFVSDQLAARGMLADWAIHTPQKRSATSRGEKSRPSENPHVHILLTMRPLTAQGFGGKRVPVRDASGELVRDARGRVRTAFATPWGSPEDVRELRACWAEYQNFHLAMHGFEVRVDHRSYKDQGIDVSPTTHRGVHAESMHARGKPAERIAQHEQSRHRQARQLRADPNRLIDLVAAKRAVFTRADLAYAARVIDDKEERRRVVDAAEASPRLVALDRRTTMPDGRVRGTNRYATRKMIELERDMVRDAAALAAARGPRVSERHLSAAFGDCPTLDDEQRRAVRHLTADSRLVAMAGVAGAGKTTALAAAKDAWERAGLRVVGAAPSAKAAEAFSKSAGIATRTLASYVGLSDGRFRGAWADGAPASRLSPHDVLVVDEAGMVPSWQMARAIAVAKSAGAKVVLVGDARQLQPIEAGAAFRAICERVGVVDLEVIRRQKHEWQREASLALARGDVAWALGTYDEHGYVTVAPTRDDAKAAITDRYLADDAGGVKRIVLAHTNADVLDLNERIRAARRKKGELKGEDQVFRALGRPRDVVAPNLTVSQEPERLELPIAAGDRVVCLINERIKADVQLKNGMTGTVAEAKPGAMLVVFDDGRRRLIEEHAYPYVQHAYAITIHKSQGLTNEEVLVLATPGMDRSLAYVAMTRHRDVATVFMAAEDFPNIDALVRTLSRPADKETTLDYECLAFADRRGLLDDLKSWYDDAKGRMRVAEERIERLVDRSIDALLGIERVQEPGEPPKESALEAVLRATAITERWRGRGDEELPHGGIAVPSASGRSGEHLSTMALSNELAMERERRRLEEAEHRRQEVQDALAEAEERERRANGERARQARNAVQKAEEIARARGIRILDSIPKARGQALDESTSARDQGRVRERVRSGRTGSDDE